METEHAVEGAGQQRTGQQRAHRRRTLAVGVGKPGVHRREPRLRTESDEHEHECEPHEAWIEEGRVGAQLVPLEARPRATCALCLVQDDAAFFAHVGDSRIYHLRHGKVRERTRDHSHVELLLREGVITEDEIAAHPMRNLVECCLGGDAWLPGMTITRQKRLAPGDVLMVCTDGLWSGLGDDRIGALATDGEALVGGLRRLGEQSVRACGPYSDNTSAAALRYLGPGSSKDPAKTPTKRPARKAAG